MSGFEFEYKQWATMSDKIQLDIDIISIRFEYSNTNTVSDIEYPDLNTDRSELL